MSDTTERGSLPPSSRRRSLAVLALTVGCAAILMAVLPDPRAAASPPQPVQPVRLSLETGQPVARFPHTNPSHNRLPCLLCHRRESNSPRPLRSLGHTPCAGCHAEQFAASSGPMCTICHVNEGSTQVKPFPPLQSFNMTFDHARHKGVACSTCHKPERRGVAFGIPSGSSAHTTCYSCHAPRAQSGGRDISSCGVCHKPGSYRRTPAFTKAYRVNFSHNKHGARQDLNCADCHRVRAGMPPARQVSAPAPTQHFGSERAQSCMTCHNTKRAFGESFSDCKRCHQGPTFRF